jgi:hypothetical protein
MWLQTYRQARTEHAFLLRCEGLKFIQIAPHMGVKTPQEARRLYEYFSRRLSRAMRRTRFTMKDTGNG